MKWICLFGGFLIIVCSDTKRDIETRERTCLSYFQYGVRFTFDNNDSLDGFILSPCTLTIGSMYVGDSVFKLSLIPGVGAFGVKFGDSISTAIKILGEPLFIRDTVFEETIRVKLAIWQRWDTCLVLNFANDSLNLITSYLRPVIILPFNLPWRVHKDRLVQKLGPPVRQIKFKTPLPRKFFENPKEFWLGQ